MQGEGAGLDGKVQDGKETVTHPGNFGDDGSHQAKNGTEDDEAKTKKETEGGKNLQVGTKAGGRGRGRR